MCLNSKPSSYGSLSSQCQLHQWPATSIVNSELRMPQYSVLLICTSRCSVLDIDIETYGWVTWLIQICDMTHPYMWHDSSIHVTWLIHMTSRQERQTCHTCDMTHPYDIETREADLHNQVRMPQNTHSSVNHTERSLEVSLDQLRWRLRNIWLPAISQYGVATIRRLLQNVGLFCRI